MAAMVCNQSIIEMLSQNREWTDFCNGGDRGGAMSVIVSSLVILWPLEMLKVAHTTAAVMP